eukprot:gene15594-24994_t
MPSSVGSVNDRYGFPTYPAQVPRAVQGGLGMQVEFDESKRGLRVARLTPGGNAELSGQVTVKDVIVELNGKNVLYHTFEDFVTELQYLDTSSAVIMLTMATCKSVDAETETWLASPSKNSAASGAASSSGPSASGRKVSNMGSSPARSAS